MKLDYCFTYESFVKTYNFSSEKISWIKISWDENAAWKDHFSLYIGSEHLYLPTSSLILWNVSKLNPWHNCVSEKLISAHVYSQNETRHIVKFDFGTIAAMSECVSDRLRYKI